MNSFLLLTYARWHFFGATKDLAKAWGNILWFAYTFFSIGPLARTYIAPWHRIAWDYGQGFSPGRFLYVLSSNLISRFMGALMRSFLIAMGLSIETALFILAAFCIVLWLALPALIALSFFYGFFLLF